MIYCHDFFGTYLLIYIFIYTYKFIEFTEVELIKYYFWCNRWEEDNLYERSACVRILTCELKSRERPRRLSIFAMRTGIS